MSNNSFVAVVGDIVDGFRQYTADKVVRIEKETLKIGREVKEEIINTSPVRAVRAPTRSRQTRRVALNPRRQPGAYKAGWASQKKEQGQRLAVMIYNKTNYQLVHLLELGHLNRDKLTYTRGRPHVKPAEEKGRQELDTAIDRILRE
jgi:hypothetical protein